MIEFENVSKFYGDRVGVKDVNIRIDKGEFVFLIGPTGAGKSTFVKLFLKMLEPDKGRIIYRGKDITHLPQRLIPVHRRSLGIVFQDFSLLPQKTAFENVAFAMEILQMPKHSIERAVPKALSLVGLDGLAHKRPAKLSIGEQQRVAIARAIVVEPDVLIADEPTGNLDAETGREIMKILKQINERGKTVLMVTHDRDIVNRMRERVVAIKDGLIVRDEKGGAYHPDEDDDPAIPSHPSFEEALPL